MRTKTTIQRLYEQFIANQLLGIENKEERRQLMNHIAWFVNFCVDNGEAIVIDDNHVGGEMYLLNIREEHEKASPLSKLIKE
jgi:hypothetical protein